MTKRTAGLIEHNTRNDKRCMWDGPHHTMGQTGLGVHTDVEWIIVSLKFLFLLLRFTLPGEAIINPSHPICHKHHF